MTRLGDARLVVTRLPADFRRGHDHCAGPWVLAGIDRDFDDWRDFAFAEVFDDTDAWVAANVSCRRLAHAQVPRWAAVLNARHGTAHDHRFWRVMLLDWLITTTYTAWLRWRQIEAFRDHYDGPPLVVELTGLPEGYRLANIQEFLRGLAESELDGWLCSLIADVVLPSEWPRRRVASVRRKLKPSQPPRDTRTLAGRIAHAVFGRLAVEQSLGLGGWRLPLSLFVALLPRSRPAVNYYDFAEDGIAETFPQAFRDLLDQVLTTTLPVSLADDFPILDAIGRAERYYPNRLLVTNVAAPNDRQRVVVAYAHERGEKLVGSQHGANYGINLVVGRSPDTEYRYHAFLTWGWRAHGEAPGRFQPLPSPWLSRMIASHRERKAVLILVGTLMPLARTPFHSFASVRHVFEYREQKLTFLRALPEPVRRAAAYRPYLRALQGLRDEEYVLANLPEVPALAGDFHHAMLGCRLLILDHPGTTMHSALAAGVPMICYWDREAWPICPQAEQDFEALRQAGLLFHDPVGAAVQTARVWDRVDTWWSSPEVRAARDLWCSHHALHRPDWVWQWIKGLCHLATS